jgi:hypothetical protein
MSIVGLDRVFDVSTIIADQYKPWFELGCNIECAHYTAQTTIKHEILGIYDGPTTVDDAVQFANTVEWGRTKFPVRWIAAVRQGLLVKKLTEGMRGKEKWDVEQKFVEGIDTLTWNDDKHKCSQLEVIKGVTEFFEKLPVLLLLFPDTSPIITYKKVYHRRSEMRAFLDRDKTVECFFQGM